MYSVTIIINKTIIMVDTTWIKGYHLGVDLWYEGQARIGKNNIGAIIGVDVNDEGVDIIVDTKENHEGDLTFTCHLKNQNDESQLKNYDFRRFDK